jgi:hypothetical protein
VIPASSDIQNSFDDSHIPLSRLTYQVQSCSDTVKFMAVRVGGYPNEVFEDNEETFEQLQQRIDKTINILTSLKPDCMDGDESREIIMETKSLGSYKFTAFDYIFKYCIPNFHFHLTSAYCILRTQGVPLSAFDYLDAQKDLFQKV